MNLFRFRHLASGAIFTLRPDYLGPVPMTSAQALNVCARINGLEPVSLSPCYERQTCACGYELPHTIACPLTTDPEGP